MTEPTENSQNIIQPVEVSLGDSEDSLFEESVLSSSFNKRVPDEIGLDYEAGQVGGLEDTDYRPGDLVDLRGLFDEDAVDPLKDGATLDFEEIPDDIDIDEPIEVEEELTRAGKIMDVTVKVALVFFGLIAFGFIINAILFTGAIFTATNYEQRMFVDVGKWEKEEATIDMTILTEGQNFGRFIRAELMNDTPLEAKIYLPANGSEEVKDKDLIANVRYRVPEKDKIEYNAGKRSAISVKGMKMILNQSFDSGRLSGFMEPRKENMFHERYPRKLIIHLNASISILSFWIPVHYVINYKFKVDMDKIDSKAEEKKLKMTKEFDFNPKFVHIAPFKEGDDHLSIKIRQPIPKFYAPPFYEIAVHIPEMNLKVKQFTMKDPFAKTTISEMFKNSVQLMKATVKPFRMIMTDEDMTPNIMEIDVIIEKTESRGLINVLKAFRDGDDLGSLAFLVMSEYFTLLDDLHPTVVEQFNKENCFVRFMGKFWARQAYPVGDGTGPALPSVPELYDPSVDSAMKVKFNGVKQVPGRENPCLSFDIAANTHYVISEFKLPLLMMSGQLPPIKFKVVKIGRQQNVIARFKMTHVNNTPASVDPNDPSQPIGKQIFFNFDLDIYDLELLTKFGLKLTRMRQAATLDYNKETETYSMKQLIGSMFDDTLGIEILADAVDPDWISPIASVFDMKISLSGESVEFVYKGNDKPVIKGSEPPKPVVYSVEDDEKIKNSIANLLSIDMTKIQKSAEHSAVGGGEKFDYFFKKELQKQLTELKNKVKEEEAFFYKTSIVNETRNFNEEAYLIAEDKVSIDEHDKLETKELLKYVNTRENALDAHKNISKVRDLVNKLILLKKAIPVTDSARQLGVFTNIESTETEMSADVIIGLPANGKEYDDQVLIEWDEFSMGMFDENKVPIVSFELKPESFNYSLTDGNLYESSDSDSIKVKAVISAQVDLKRHMKAFKKFFEDAMNKSKSFLPCHVSFESTNTPTATSAEPKTLNLQFKGVLPSGGIKEVGSIIPKAVPTGPVAPPEPDFFTNLSKSYFDFIGYGYSRLIFNAILPNPNDCPVGSSIINVEINLPPTSSFVFGTAVSGSLNNKECIAAINTARPLRIWTQIIDGVLCNMYAVADGFDEQEAAIQSRVPKLRTNEIVASFLPVLELRKDYEFNDDATETANCEIALVRNIKSETTERAAGLGKRIELITAVPVSFEILNFDRMMKMIDAFSDKSLTTFAIDDPTISNGPLGHDKPILLNSIIGALASNYPMQFNTPEQVERSREAQANRRLNIDHERKIVLKVDTESSSPNEMIIKTHLFMTQVNEDDSSTQKTTELENRQNELGDKPYIVYESLSPELRFVHPIIRWGKTVLRFKFPEFIVELKLSAGDIKVADDGAKIIFDQLENFKMDISVKARSIKTSPNPSKNHPLKHLKEVFKVTSIRQVFKRCQEFFNEKLDSSALPNDTIETKSIVSYGKSDAQQFHFYGSANLNNFFILQKVMLKKMFSEKPPPPGYNPKEDPTFMDFSMLISLGGENRKVRTRNVPLFTMPCFMTNFCSAEQLSYSGFNKHELLENGAIPVTLHVRNTFQPITAAMAAGFATFVPVFHMQNYPGELQWILNVPKDQVMGIEMNGQTMFYGKAGPLNIKRSAVIPYPQNQSDRSSSSSSEEEGLDFGSDLLPNSPLSQKDMYVDFSEVADLDKEFFSLDLSEEFEDQVDIPVLAQIPDSLPNVLRNMLWSLFFVPIDTFTLHPPLINIEGGGFKQLVHAPIAVAMSDSVVYKDRDDNGKSLLIKPSLLTKCFTAFIEESSGPGMEMHKPIDSTKISHIQTRLHYTWNYSLGGSSDLVKAFAWVQFPWPMGPIGFDYGKTVKFKIYLPNASKDIVATGELTRMHMSGKVARMRVEAKVNPKLFLPALYFAVKHLNIGRSIINALGSQMSKNQLTSLIASLGYYTWAACSGTASLFTRLVNVDYYAPEAMDWLNSFTNEWVHQDITAKLEVDVDSNFRVLTEATVPKKLFQPPSIPRTKFSSKPIKLTATDDPILLTRYRKYAPQAVACVFLKDEITAAEMSKQNSLWSDLDFGMTRVYYLDELKGIKPKDHVQIFLQLRTSDQLPICGRPTSITGVAVMIEYIRPKDLFEVLFNESVSFANPSKRYYETMFDPYTSVYLVVDKNADYISFEYSGRYRIYAALLRNEKNFKALDYKEIKFTEIYVQNSR